VGVKKKHEALGIKLDDDRKILNTTKAKSGPSLTKYKQAKRNKNQIATKDQDTKTVMGKTVVKSKNRKRL
jgi:hypothetical protein